MKPKRPNAPVKTTRKNASGASSATHHTLMEARYCGLLEAVPDPMVIVNESSEIVLLNNQAERQFGYSRAELMGKAVTSIIPQGFAERLIADGLRSASEAKEQKLGMGIELIGQRKDGSEFPMDLMLTPLRSPEATFIAAAIRDVSMNKIAEGDVTQLRAKYLVLQEAERLKDEFISTVSHELRTPLTSIAGSLALLDKSSNPLPELAARLIDIANRSSQRLVRLVSDILDIQKMEFGLVVFYFKRIQLRSLVELAIEANRGFAEGFGVQLRLKDTSTNSDVRADSDRLIQVVTNLLSNAVKFTPRDTEVTISIEKIGDNIRLAVRDHGPGIPVAFAPRVFQKFAQVDSSTTRPKDGTGLGLSIVKQIVDRLGGEVGFSDAPGGGAVFYVDLPTWEQGERIAIDPDNKPDAARILLCEDDPYTSIALRDQLRQAGFATDFAYDPAEAITYAQDTAYGAVLVDLLLPEGDGLGLIQTLRGLPSYSKTPIIVVSAEANRRRDEATTAKLNVLDWLNKPVDFDHLKRVLPKLPVQPHP